MSGYNCISCRVSTQGTAVVSAYLLNNPAAGLCACRHDNCVPVGMTTVCMWAWQLCAWTAKDRGPLHTPKLTFTADFHVNWWCPGSEGSRYHHLGQPALCLCSSRLAWSSRWCGQQSQECECIDNYTVWLQQNTMVPNFQVCTFSIICPNTQLLGRVKGLS